MQQNQQLTIFSAGVARKVVTHTIEQWNEQNPQLPAYLITDGSVDLIRRCLSGEPCDILILADNSIIESMIFPNSASGYVIFAGNRMVVAANEGYEINSDNWKSKLLDPSATFDHHNPYADPGGYRAVMSMMLADYFEEGLASKLLKHPGHFGMTQSSDELPEIKYCFDYYTRAADRGAPIADLPTIMDLSRDDFAEDYAKVQFHIDATHSITAAPICHALTIPQSAVHPEEAKQFANLFLTTDFTKYGFVKRFAVKGANILMIPSAKISNP